MTGVRVRGGKTVEVDQVVIAAGVWSEQIDGVPPEARVPIRPVKGQIMRLHDPAGAGLLTRIVRMPTCYLVPRGDGRYVLGATMEERGFDTTVTAGATFELLRDAIELVPGLSELVIDELSAGLRPGTPDNAPAIGPELRSRSALGHGPLPPRDPVGPDHRRDRRRTLTGGEPSALAATFDAGALRRWRRRCAHDRHRQRPRARAPGGGDSAPPRSSS